MTGRWNPRAANQLAHVARVLGEIEGRLAVPVARVQKSRRDYTARELREMADNAAEGIPPATSPARALIKRAQETGDFERANALIAEVKEKAPALARLARAAEKAERRAAARAAHVHRCKDWPSTCGVDGMGPCRCKCGAVQIIAEHVVDGVRGRFWWQLPNGSLVPWPDPRE